MDGSLFNSPVYKNWRNNRINKLIEILGGGHWFKNKKILELWAYRKNTHDIWG